jgi:hypothetical protein
MSTRPNRLITWSNSSLTAAERAMSAVKSAAFAPVSRKVARAASIACWSRPRWASATVAPCAPSAAATPVAELAAGPGDEGDAVIEALPMRDSGVRMLRDGHALIVSAGL